MDISFEQRQVCLGTLLGNGFICNRSYLCIQHSIKDAEYLLMKAENLIGLGRKTPIYKRKNIIGWRSKSDPAWSSFYSLCYSNCKKTVVMPWLDQLHAIGLAVWVFDSGTFVGGGRNNLMLRTESYYDQNHIIRKYFQEVSIECSLNKIRNSYNVLFTKSGTEKILDIVGSFIPQCIIKKWGKK